MSLSRFVSQHLPRFGFALALVAFFTSAASAQVPGVATPTSASITMNSATLGGTVTSAGGGALTARGVVLSLTSVNPAPALGGAGVTTLVATGTDAGAFTVSAASLTPGGAYTFRAYATNASGTAYSDALTFATEAATLPTGLAQAFENRQPTAALTWMIRIRSGLFPSTDPALVSAMPFLGEIRLVAFDANNFNNSNWAPCNGQLLPISQNQALFALLGTNFGGNGQTTFALPDLRGRIPVGSSSTLPLGTSGGSDSTVLIPANVAGHTHSYAHGLTTLGVSAPVNNLQPYVALNFSITKTFANDFWTELSWVRIFAFELIPGGHATCDGSLLPIAANTALFSRMGTTYGGDGKSTFALPDLRGRTLLGQGQSPDTTSRYWGETGGSETFTLTPAELPAHQHTYGGGITGLAGGNQPIDTMQPFAPLYAYISVNGIYGQIEDTYPAVGEIRLWAGAPREFNGLGWFSCEGPQMPIAEYEVLFQLIGTIYGGDGESVFNLPSLGGRALAGVGQSPGVSESHSLGQSFGTEMVTLTVNNLPPHTHAFNTTPSFADGATQSLSLVEDGSAADISAFFDVIDPDFGQTLTWSIAGGPGKGSLAGFPVNASTASDTTPLLPSGLTYTPLADRFGADSFVIQVSDGTTTDTITVNVTISEVNDAPVPANDTLSTLNEDSGTRFIAISTLLGNDSRGAQESAQTLTLISVADPVGGSVSISGTNVLFTPALNFNGAASFTYTARDNGTTAGLADLKTGTATVSFTITPINDAPTLAANLGLTLAEGATAALTASRLDYDDLEQADNAISYQVTSLPVRGTLAKGGVALAVNGTFTQADINTGLVTYAHNGSETTSDSFGFTVSDGAGGVITNRVFALTITAVNDLPAVPADANPAANVVTEGAAAGALVGITASSTDADSPTLAYSLTDNAGGRFAIDSSTGVVTVADATLLDYETATSHEITVQVNDGAGGLRSASFTIAVTNDAPSAPTDSDPAPNQVVVRSANGTPIGLTASAGDANGGTVTYSLSNDAGGRFAIDANTGVVTLANTSLITAGAATTYDITVKAADASGLFQSSNFVILVMVRNYTTWKATVFAPGQMDDAAVSGPEVDPDGDGVKNLLEYAFDLDPLAPDATGLPEASLLTVDGLSYLALAYTRSKLATDLTYTVQASNDLATWSPSPVAEVNVTDHGDTETVLARDTVATGASAKRFLRVHVALP